MTLSRKTFWIGAGLVPLLFSVSSSSSTPAEEVAASAAATGSCPSSRTVLASRSAFYPGATGRVVGSVLGVRLAARPQVSPTSAGICVGPASRDPSGQEPDRDTDGELRHRRSLRTSRAPPDVPGRVAAPGRSDRHRALLGLATGRANRRAPTFSRWGEVLWGLTAETSLGSASPPIPSLGVRIATRPAVQGMADGLLVLARLLLALGSSRRPCPCCSSRRGGWRTSRTGPGS